MAVTRLLAALLLAFGMLLGVSQQSAARVVGILFDDSGSMAPRINLPTFGAQLLVSTLDGRDGKDRLYTVRLSQAIKALGRNKDITDRDVPAGGVWAGNVEQWIQQARSEPLTRERLATDVEQQATISRIAREWPHAEPDTPYEPVEIILDRLTRDVQDGEDAILVVITDGSFSHFPELARIKASFAAYAERLTAKRTSLRVEFLLIAPSAPGTITEVQQQGIRAAMLQQFNGSETSGSYEVTNLDQLLGALKDVIADVAGTDWRAQQSYSTASGNRLTVTTPLSVVRLITVSTAAEPRRPPTLLNPLPNAIDLRHLDSAMIASDTAPGIQGQKLRGRTEQMRFQPALAPGEYALNFDLPVGNDVFLLFETATTVGLRLLAADGKEASSDSEGYVLLRGAPYTLEATLSDVVNGVARPVKLSSLRGRSDFTTTVESGNAATRALSMTTEAAADRAVAPYQAMQVGVVSFRAQARLAGLVSARSERRNARVIDGAVSFATEFVSAEPCLQCAAGEMRATFGPGVSYPYRLGAIRITPTLPIPGTATMDVTGLPPGVALARPGGAVARDGDTLELANGVPVEFGLLITGPIPSAVDHKMPFAFRLTAAAPLSGAVLVQGAIGLQVPDARLRFTGHSAGDATVPPRLGGAELESGAFSIDLALENAVSQPTPGEFSLDWSSGLVAGTIDLRDYAIHVHPRTRWWCPCFLYWMQPGHTLTVRWEQSAGWQRAAITIPVEVIMTRSEMLRSCGLLLLAALGLIWLILGLLNIARTRRFPSTAVAKVKEGRQPPRDLDLRGWNHTWFRAFLPWRAWRLSPPHERTQIEGLLLEAMPGGALLVLSHSAVDYTVIRLGESIPELLKANPKLQTLRLIWNDEIERQGRAKFSIRLLRALTDPTVV